MSDVPTNEGHELDSFLGKSFEEKPIWKELYENVHDVFFPKKLPPLVLTSKPIPVPDRMAVKRSPTFGRCRSTRMPSPARFSFRAAMTPHGSFAFHTATWRT